MGELFKRIDVCVLKAFRSRIGRGNSQTFGSGNRTDDSQMSASIVPEIGKSGIHHSCETFDIGTCGIQLDFHIQFHILETDAGTEQK